VTIEDMQALEGDLIYVEHEHSVDFIPVSESELIERSPTRGGTSILLGTLQIEVDIPSATLLYPWGQFPRGHWKKARIEPTGFGEGGIRIANTEDLELKPAVSLEVWPEDECSTLFDPTTGWLCVTTKKFEGLKLVEFARGAVIGLDGNEMNALWLKPHFYSTHPAAKIAAVS